MILTPTGYNHSQDQDIERVARRMAAAARSAILPYFRQTQIATENKDAVGFDPVTVADRAAEQAMRDVLAAERPLDGILGEEFGETPSQNGLRWVLDPIDGTRGFISGTPTWGVLIALEQIGRGPIFGIIAQPYMNEMFIGGLNRSMAETPYGTVPLATSTTSRLEDAIIFTTFPEVGTSTEQHAFASVAQQCKLTRYGMDCYAYALLAMGQVDLVVEAGLNAYDIQAPIAVIQAAGGIVTNWRGKPAHGGGQVIAAANATLHDRALALLAPFAQDVT